MFVALVASVLIIDSSTALAQGDVGYRDFSYEASGVSAPTGEKPQSKLWHADGVWWGALFSTTADAYTVHRLDWATQTWSDTGVVLEPRNSARLDVLFDGSNLYVLSAGTNDADPADSVEFRRLAYDPVAGSYALDLGFPVTVASGGTEAAVMDKDSTGMVWATFTRDGQAFVAHTQVDDMTWSAPAVLPFAGAQDLSSDDISAVVAYGGKIGVMWSNQSDSTMYFAHHIDGDPDTQWILNPAVQAPGYADDHINLKSLQAASDGRVFAVTKTALTAGSAPLILLLELDQHGSWKRHTVATVSDDHTRPIVLVDPENEKVYVFATSTYGPGRSIYVKEAPLSNLNFAAGAGTPFIRSSSDGSVNNVSSTKQPVDSSTGLVAIASDDSTDFYLHNAMTLGPDIDPPDTLITTAPADPSGADDATFDFAATEGGATFECQTSGTGWQSCAPPYTVVGLAPGSHTFEVRAVDAAGNVDPTPASRTWSVIAATTYTVISDADAYVYEASPGSNYGDNSEVVADAGSGVTKQALVRFPVDESRPIVSATMRLWINNGSRNGPIVDQAIGEWQELAVNWLTRPAASGNPIADLGDVEIGTWLEIDVTDRVTGAEDLSVVFLPQSTDAMKFDSRESTYPPELRIVVADEPVPVLPVVSLGVVDGVGGEPADGAELVVSRSGSVEGDLVVGYSVGGSAVGGVDYVALSGVVTIGAGLSSASIVVVPVDDGLVEGDELVEVSLVGGVGYELGVAVSGSVTITDDDEPPPDTTVTVVAEADAYIDERRPNSNRGGDTSLQSDGGSGIAKQALMRFNLTGVSSNVTSAVVRVWVTNGSRNGPELHMTDIGWSEDTVNWNNRPATISALVDDAGSIESGFWYDFDVTDAIAGPGAYSFLASSISTDSTRFASRESENPPMLIVDWVDGPDTSPPDTTINSAPAALTTDSTASLRFVSNEPGSTFECSLDGVAWAGCVSPYVVANLSPGPHSFEVRATDASGNLDPTPATASWTVQAGGTVVLVPAADAHIDERRPTANGGTSTSLISDGGTGSAKESLLQFEVAGASTNVVSATIRVWVTNSTRDGPEVFLTDTGWGETSVNWSTRPTVLGGAVANAGRMTAGTWYEFDVTNAIAGSGTYSFLLSSVSTDSMRFSSRETAQAPELRVEWLD